MSESTASTPRRSREARTDEILEAARELFTAQGYEATTMASIAARVGVVEGLVYKYFPGKRELLIQVLARWYEQMFGDYTRELARLRGNRERLHRLVWHHLCAMRDKPRLCRLMFREVQSEHDYVDTTLHALNRRYTRVLLDVINAGVAAGEFRADLPPTLLRSLVYGGIEHHAWNYVWGRGTLDVDRLANQIVSLLCDGFALKTPAGPSAARA